MVHNRYQLFASYSIFNNAIILNDEDFSNVYAKGTIQEPPFFMYYAYYIPEWQKTKDIGLSINDTINDTFITGVSSSLPYSFDNPGLNYSIIRETNFFTLIIYRFITGGCISSSAAGSFIYFRLYTRLELDKKQFDVLKRLGLTDREFKKIVNRQLFLQFFFPRGMPCCIAHSHSCLYKLSGMLLRKFQL